MKTFLCALVASLAFWAVGGDSAFAAAKSRSSLIYVDEVKVHQPLDLKDSKGNMVTLSESGNLVRGGAIYQISSLRTDYENNTGKTLINLQARGADSKDNVDVKLYVREKIPFDSYNNVSFENLDISADKTEQNVGLSFNVDRGEWSPPVDTVRTEFCQISHTRTICERQMVDGRPGPEVCRQIEVRIDGHQFVRVRTSYKTDDYEMLIKTAQGKVAAELGFQQTAVDEDRYPGPCIEGPAPRNF